MLQANISSKYPVFTVSGLDSGKLLKIIIYAINVKGRSDSVLLEAFTLKAAEKQTGKLSFSLCVSNFRCLNPIRHTTQPLSYANISIALITSLWDTSEVRIDSSRGAAKKKLKIVFNLLPFFLLWRLRTGRVTRMNNFRDFCSPKIV